MVMAMMMKIHFDRYLCRGVDLLHAVHHLCYIVRVGKDLEPTTPTLIPPDAVPHNKHNS